MDSNSLVSIIIPIYKTARYLERSVRSVMAQSYPRLEIILIDDGSTDTSLSICKQLQAEDHRIIVHHQSNAGASIARNWGLDHCMGEYIMMVDSDDWIDPNMVDCLLQKASDGYDLVTSIVPNDIVPWESSREISPKELTREVLVGALWSPNCKLFACSRVGNLRFPTPTVSEDYVFVVRLIERCEKVYFMHRSFYHREHRPDSLSRIGLCDRRFDEYRNVLWVSDHIHEVLPEYASLADVHLAETCVKLVTTICEQRAEKEYHSQLQELLRCIRSNYWSFLRNSHMNRNVCLLLAFCFSVPSIRMANWLLRFLRSKRSHSLQRSISNA